MEKTKENTPWWKWLVVVGSVTTATTVILSASAWLFQEKIVNFIIDVYDEQQKKEIKFEVDMSSKMSKDGEKINPEDVRWKLAKMFRDFNSKTQFENDLISKWIPHLESEVAWRKIGYFVDVNNPSIVKFHHWDGRDYDAWNDEQGWFYMKDGYKFYN